MTIEQLNRMIIRCEKCPRLVRWRKQVAKVPPRRYQGQKYWAKPLPGFGDPGARLLIVGLAPAAHGGNRTGRIFTGDRSGDWLYQTLYAFGFANQVTSVHAGDGLKLTDCYICAAVRCAPPENKPLMEEFENCRPYLVQEIKLLKNIRVVVALGKIAFDSFLKAYQESAHVIPKPRPQFRHSGSFNLPNDLMLIGSYHPSQQNTFTGKLTREMFYEVFRKAREAIDSS
ncbi:MAG: uracil-DNA glycosylase [Deltaproteobacteria bacterium]|nr:uracil-DNA glycosylase [Deltaproteobacteria bacterium]